ncbi:GNAT family N-acetyltransferase [Tabrizicola sp.]|uniref:GNAT family N-acetyltransferase n=1 Tax=Tabrizicola sp. TaxID=2005166 RepID=UPI003F2A47BB
MKPRAPDPADAAMLARIHIAAWQETYTGLLPDDEIARASNPERRLAQWTGAIARNESRIALIDDLGFAQMGHQRDPELAALGYPEELWAIYLLRAAQGRGLGAALLRFALGPAPQPFTALVLSGNHVAAAFYTRQGGRLLSTRDEAIGLTPIREDVYVWDDPLRLVKR